MGVGLRVPGGWDVIGEARVVWWQITGHWFDHHQIYTRLADHYPAVTTGDDQGLRV